MVILLRLLIVISCFASSLYGVIVLRRHFLPSYFEIAVCGMFAAFLSRLFFFLLTLSNGDDTAFSVGVFGQAAIYLFYMTANRAYVPPEAEERGKHELCPVGMLAAAVPFLLFLFAAIRVGSMSGYVGECVYICTMIPAVYFACKNIRNKYRNPFRKALIGFNLCVIALVYLNAASELLNVLGNGEIIGPAVLTCLTVPVLLLMLPVLRKGLGQWEL